MFLSMLERHVDPSHPYQREVRWGLPSSTGDDGILVMVATPWGAPVEAMLRVLGDSQEDV